MNGMCTEIAVRRYVKKQAIIYNVFSGYKMIPKYQT